MPPKTLFHFAHSASPPGSPPASGNLVPPIRVPRTPAQPTHGLLDARGMPCRTMSFFHAASRGTAAAPVPRAPPPLTIAVRLLSWTAQNSRTSGLGEEAGGAVKWRQRSPRLTRCCLSPCPPRAETLRESRQSVPAQCERGRLAAPARSARVEWRTRPRPWLPSIRREPVMPPPRARDIRA
ncbi:hypothetical protein HC256_009932 [Beauveria bassiana]|nr:hypothetical protein HC256_009932 [Beauveria bassiana]